MSRYIFYLKFGKNILSEFIDANHPDFSTNGVCVQRLASYMNKNHSEGQVGNLRSFASEYLMRNFSRLSYRQIALIERDGEFIKTVIKCLGKDINDFPDEISAAKFIARKSHLKFREAIEQKYIELHTDLFEAEFRRLLNINGPEVKIEGDHISSEPAKSLEVSGEFMKMVKVSTYNYKTEYEINLRGKNHDMLVENMRGYVFSEILKKKNFTDLLKICFWLDDGSFHFDYFNESNIKYLYEKFSDKNWDRISEDIYPSEGSDKLILYINLKRIYRISFILFKNPNIYHPGEIKTEGSNSNNSYITRGGSFFPYLVKSKVDLTRFQIISELNKETVQLIDEHCLVYALRQAGFTPQSKVLQAAKRMINKCNFKLTQLKDLANLFNLEFQVKYYKLDANFDQTCNYKIEVFKPTESNKDTKTIKLVVIAEHYMIDEKVKFNCRYYNNKGKIKALISQLEVTKPKLASQYKEKRHLFKEFKDKTHLKFFDEESLPEFSIFEVLHTLKDAGKFSEINDSNYWVYYGKIRYENIAKSDSLEELNDYEFSKYKPYIYHNKKDDEENQSKELEEKLTEKYIVFADFEASTDGAYHREYCICARKYKAIIKDELRQISPENSILLKSFDISNEFEEFNSYSRNCSVEFLDWLDDKSIVFFHNLTYDINFLLKHVTDFKSNIIFHGRDMMHNVFYHGKNITFKDSLAMLNCKLSAFPDMFKLDSGEKEAFPYDYYSSKNAFNKHGSIQEALKSVIPENRAQFLKNIERIPGVKIDENTFDMEKYALFYCMQDVRILAEGLIAFNKMCKDGLGMDCFNTLSISGLANKYFEEHVYFKNDDIYKVGGPALKFMMKTIYGGRCMVRDNTMYKIDERIVDFDAVSLYPSAIKRSYVLTGKPAIIPESWDGKYLLDHLFEEGQTSPSKDRYISGFFAKINITKIGRKLHMPIITNRFNEELPLNVNECGIMYVNHITLQDLIKFQEIEFELIEGLYYYKNRDTTCQEVIQYLFDQRKKYKAEKNPIEQTFKLVMNSVYGKTIMKPINYKNKLINGTDKFEKYELKNYNYITSVEKLNNSDIYQVKKINSLLRDYNLVQFGSVILSMSKRIICEVFCLAEELDHKIYYTDTDSGHFCEGEIDQLAKEFKIRYGRELIGTELGQFHCDFNNISNDASMPVSVKSIFLGKKSYIDMLMDDKDNLGFHVRMKGIPAKTLELTANEMFKDAIPVHYKNGLFIPETNEGSDGNYSIFKLYEHLYDHHEVVFNLVNEYSPRFEFNKNRTISTKSDFIRKIKF